MSEENVQMLRSLYEPQSPRLGCGVSRRAPGR
jgi:hypothetical protein